MDLIIEVRVLSRLPSDGDMMKFMDFIGPDKLRFTNCSEINPDGKSFDVEIWVGDIVDADSINLEGLRRDLHLSDDDVSTFDFWASEGETQIMVHVTCVSSLDSYVFNSLLAINHRLSSLLHGFTSLLSIEELINDVESVPYLMAMAHRRGMLLSVQAAIHRFLCDS